MIYSEVIADVRLSPMSSSDVNRGLRYEKEKAKAHNGKHMGGPGMHDYERGNAHGEVKCRGSPVTKPELRDLVRNKGITEVESKSGFTQPAINYRDRYQPDVKILRKGKNI